MYYLYVNEKLLTQSYMFVQTFFAFFFSIKAIIQSVRKLILILSINININNFYYLTVLLLFCSE